MTSDNCTVCGERTRYDGHEITHSRAGGAPACKESLLTEDRAQQAERDHGLVSISERNRRIAERDAEVARLTAENDRLIVIAKADEWQARYWAEHDAVADREATIMAERAQSVAMRRALEEILCASMKLLADHVEQLAAYRLAVEELKRAIVGFMHEDLDLACADNLIGPLLERATALLQSPNPGKELLDAHAAEIQKAAREWLHLDAARTMLMEERDALRQRVEAAEARATCDGSTERSHAESTKAAIAALWTTNPEIAYESPAQVIGWLKGRVEAAEAASSSVAPFPLRVDGAFALPGEGHAVVGNVTELLGAIGTALRLSPVSVALIAVGSEAPRCELAERALGGEGK